MAYEGNIRNIPGLTAGADLSSDQFKFVKMSAGGVILPTTSGEPVTGVLQDKPAASGRAASVAGVGSVTKVLAGGVIAKGARIQPNANGVAITAAAAATSADKDGSTTGPFDMAAGDTMVIDVDNAGNTTATFDAASASATDTTTYPVVDQNGLTEVVTIDGGTAQTVTFSGVTTSAVSVAAQLNAQLTGCSVGASAATPATKTTGIGPFAMAAGDTMVLDTDNLGNETATWDATAATITDTTGYACADQDGKTMTVTVDGGSAQTVTFAGVSTAVLVLAAQMNAQLVGCSVDASSGQLVISTDSQGSGSTVATGAGTGGLTWAAAVAGTGDAVDISAVTATEIKTVVEADTICVATVLGTGAVRLDSPTTGITSELDFDSGNALAILTLSVEVIIGTAGGNVAITTDTKGTGSSVLIGTGTCGLAWGAPVAGTGDVVTIDAVTATEAKTVIEADTTAAVTVNADESITISSPTTGTASELDFISGNAIAILGFSVEQINGAASGTHFAGEALEAASASGDIISAYLINGLNV